MTARGWDGGTAMSFTCPDCGKTSHNPNDEREGYCGNCHRYTRDPVRIGDLECPWHRGMTLRECQNLHTTEKT